MSEIGTSAVSGRSAAAWQIAVAVLVIVGAVAAQQVVEPPSVEYGPNASPWSCLSTNTARSTVFPSSPWAGDCLRKASMRWEPAHDLRALALEASPTDLSVRVTGSTVRFAWQIAEPMAMSRSWLEVGTARGAANLAQFDTDSATTSMTVTNVPPGAYFVRVRIENATGKSHPSNEVPFTIGGAACSQPLGAPTALIGTVSGTEVKLTWQAPTTGCAPTAYVIEAGSASGLSDLIAFSTGTSATSFSGSGVANGTYFVRVRASNEGVSSAPSNEVRLAVGPSQCTAPPSAPTSLTASVLDSSVTLRWGAVAGVTTYLVEAGSVSGASNLAASATGNAATALQATAPNGTYYVRIRARNACGTSPASDELVVTVGPTGPRATADRTDDLAGAQVKVLYVLPNDGADRQLDLNGALATSVEAWERWLERVSGGQRVRLDTYQGALDIGFYRLPRSDAYIASFEENTVNEILSEIKAAGFNNPNKVYAVYYDGNNLVHCGQATVAAGVGGVIRPWMAVAFLQGTLASRPGLLPCPQQTVPSNRATGLTPSPDLSGYWEFVMAHEVFHTLGAVPICAPNNVAGHVGDSATDLMYAGSERWNPSVLDFNRDDYFRHGRACLDIAQSAFLTPRP
jgi:hypothetical protein